jgi:hypothetical protein
MIQTNPVLRKGTVVGLCISISNSLFIVSMPMRVQLQNVENIAISSSFVIIGRIDLFLIFFINIFFRIIDDEKRKSETCEFFPSTRTFMSQWITYTPSNCKTLVVLLAYTNALCSFSLYIHPSLRKPAVCTHALLFLRFSTYFL